MYDTNSHLQIRTLMRYPPLPPQQRGSTAAGGGSYLSPFFGGSARSPAPLSPAASGAAPSPQGPASSSPLPGTKQRQTDTMLPQPGSRDDRVSVLFTQSSRLYIGWSDCIKVCQPGRVALFSRQCPHQGSCPTLITRNVISGFKRGLNPTFAFALMPLASLPGCPYP